MNLRKDAGYNARVAAWQAQGPAVIEKPLRRVLGSLDLKSMPAELANKVVLTYRRLPGRTIKALARGTV